MNEIEKLYELADVQPQYKKRIECKEGRQVGQPCGKCPCINCDKSIFEDVMPPFTAEKQLELIKWLARKDYGNDAESLLINIRDGYNYLSVGITTDFGTESLYEDFTFDNKQFDEALAGLVNKLWQKLTEEECKQVRNILE